MWLYKVNSLYIQIYYYWSKAKREKKEKKKLIFFPSFCVPQNAHLPFWNFRCLYNTNVYECMSNSRCTQKYFTFMRSFKQWLKKGSPKLSTCLQHADECSAYWQKSHLIIQQKCLWKKMCIKNVNDHFLLRRFAKFMVIGRFGDTIHLNYISNVRFNVFKMQSNLFLKIVFLYLQLFFIYEQLLLRSSFGWSNSSFVEGKQWR